MSSTPSQGWMSSDRAAAHLGITQRTLYRLIDRGQVRAYKLGRVIRLRCEDVDAFLAHAQLKPGDLSHLYPDSHQPPADDQVGDEPAPEP